MTLGGMRLRIHPLMPLVLALMYMLSGGQALFPSLLALGLHEGAHLFVALKTRARIDEIELMPFGAAIRLYELWEISSGRLLLIALAGPAMNLLAGMLMALALYAAPALAASLTPFIHVNLALAFINLIPALPLDGGRAFCAVLSLRLPRARCVRIGVRNGKILSGLLLAGTCLYLIRFHRLHLGILLTAVYIFASGEREKRQAEGASLRLMFLASAPLSTPAMARWIAVKDTDTLLAASRLWESGCVYLFAVMDAGGSLRRVVTQEEVNELLKQRSQARFRDLPERI